MNDAINETFDAEDIQIAREEEAERIWAKLDEAIRLRGLQPDYWPGCESGDEGDVLVANVQWLLDKQEQRIIDSREGADTAIRTLEYEKGMIEEEMSKIKADLLSLMVWWDGLIEQGRLSPSPEIERQVERLRPHVASILGIPSDVRLGMGVRLCGPLTGPREGERLIASSPGTHPPTNVLEMTRGWVQIPVKCRKCDHRWRAVRPVETEPGALECPGCGAIGAEDLDS